MNALRYLNKEDDLTFWLPRISAILSISVIAYLGLSAVRPTRIVVQLLGEYVYHLVPSLLIIMFLLVAWKHERLGGYLFLFAAFLFFLQFIMIPMTVSLLCIGGLFLIHYSHTHSKRISRRATIVNS